MASGHVNRTNRPNTWLLRPLLHREESSCQPGAVHTWPTRTTCALQQVVGCPGYSGRDADVVVTAALDPFPTFLRLRDCKPRNLQPLARAGSFRLTASED